MFDMLDKISVLLWNLVNMFFFELRFIGGLVIVGRISILFFWEIIENVRLS